LQPGQGIPVPGSGRRISHDVSASLAFQASRPTRQGR
jgi:hypothetical protein